MKAARPRRAIRVPLLTTAPCRRECFSATASNTGFVSGGIAAVTEGGGNATATNSGNNQGGLAALTTLGGNAVATNSGTSFGVAAATAGGGNATTINSGTSIGGLAAATAQGGNATIVNSGTSIGGIDALALDGSASVTNSGTDIGGIALASNRNTTLTNSGTISNFGSVAIELVGTTATLTNIVGGHVIGAIGLFGATDTVNFVGGNWLFTVATPGNAPAINTNGAPFVVSPATGQIAVLDPTSFALADRSLTNFTGEVQQTLQGRFDGMAVGGGSGAALGFAGAPSTQGVADIADQAAQAFSGLPSMAMSYASDPRPVLGKAPAAAAPYYDTTVWFSSFGGERKQDADGAILPATDLAFGGTLGVDRAFGSNLRLGGFLGGGASFENVELSVQSINSTYAFGGGYGRFDWVS
ncbi:MAG: hypothetical protein WAK55_07880 [Xanthobacteraceae bacterium]